MPGLIASASIDDIQIPGFNENVCRYQKKKNSFSGTFTQKATLSIVFQSIKTY